MLHLPIDPLLPEILAKLRKAQCLVIEAAPGAGKTTRVPPALLEFGPVLVLEPRRIAARLAARRVSDELGEKPGETVGFQVRFEEVAGPKTRLRFLTEGVLTRRMLNDPELRGVSTVVLDEFHERHLESDLALALLRHLQKTKRTDLRIVVMSATLDAKPVARYLNNCETVRSEGRLFELAIAHLPYSPLPIEDQVAAALPKLQSKGHILVFLPGAAEIRRTQRALSTLNPFPLYGDLTPAEQDLAIAPSDRRKIILATNIAESSITIDGVSAVIDSGLARIASDSPWTGLPRLDVSRISKASAAQRAGRAGRQGPGEALRLYTAEDFHRRPDHDIPEIARRELSQVCLQLEAMGIHDLRELEWLDAPPDAAVTAAEALLDRLHARGENASRMARLPLHPRLARLVMEADSDDGCATAALVSTGERTKSTDLLQALDAPLEGRTLATYNQIRRAARPTGHGRQLEIAVLAAFPDRVIKSGNQFQVAIDAEERSDQPAPIIRLSCAIEPDWLMDLFPERIRERNGAVWNRQAERVEAISALLYDDLIITETRGGVPDPDQAADLLIANGGAGLIDRDDLEALLARVGFAAKHSAIRPIGDSEIDSAIRSICRRSTRLSDLKGASIASALLATVNQRLLNEIAPLNLKLPSGRQTKVHYEVGKTPWAASRMQDFFGMKESPRVANGKVPLVLHLLAPNQRAVQTTSDLAGFWERLYPQVRKELGRRYPRHKWPESPL